MSSWVTASKIWGKRKGSKPPKQPSVRETAMFSKEFSPRRLEPKLERRAR